MKSVLPLLVNSQFSLPLDSATMAMGEESLAQRGTFDTVVRDRRALTSFHGPGLEAALKRTRT